MSYTQITIELARQFPELSEKIGRSISFEELGKIRAKHSGKIAVPKLVKRTKRVSKKTK